MNRLVFLLAITVGAVVLAMIGNWHFVYGSKVATQAIEKVSWSLGESIINIDEVGNLPMIFARSK